MKFRSVPFLAAVTPSGGGTTFVRFATLADMSETGDGTTGWIYTGTANAGNGQAADYTLASGVAGGVTVQTTAGGSSWPLLEFRTVDSGTWSDDFHLFAYNDGSNWVAQKTAFVDVITTARTYVADDWVRITFGAGDTFLVEIARAASPTTWLELASGSHARSATLYVRIQSLIAAGAVFTAPQVA